MSSPHPTVTTERVIVLLEQLQDIIKEQNRLILLELEPSESEMKELSQFVWTVRESVEALGSPALGAEYSRLVGLLKDLPIDTEGMDIAPPPPPVERPRDGKRVRFSDVRQEFEHVVPERYHDEPENLRTQFDHNQTLMMEQDMRLENLGQSVHRTHQMGVNINDELDVHIGSLSDLEAQTDAAQGRLDGARTRVERFNHSAREGGSCLLITVLTLVLFILLVIL